MAERMTVAERAAFAKEANAMLAAVGQSTPSQRIVRKKLTARLKGAHPEDVKAIALAVAKGGRRWLACEIVEAHRGALESLTLKDVEAFGEGMASWEAVDGFGVLMAGAAWRNGAISDADVRRWARSDDLWWRRAALVTTTGLNAKSRGGAGDAKRTLAVAKLLVDDREDMVVKAMSWALRELAKRDPDAVKAFLKEHDGQLAARVKREVGNKLRTGLKNPKGR
jgi:3-methyladenine DNA glycosylase AlkD